MITHDELTDLMATRLSKGEDLDLIYTNPKNHIVCFIPTYEPGGGDSTKCYFVDGREELVCLPMRTITRELAVQEGLRPNYIMTSDGRRSSYTSPKTYGPHLTFAHIKCRRPVGKDVVYGLFNVAIPYEYIVTEGPEPERSHARTLQLRAQNASPHQTQPKPTSRGRTIYRLERPNEITRWRVKVELRGERKGGHIGRKI